MTIKYASNGKRDLHELEGAYDIMLDRFQNGKKWKYDANRLKVVEYLQECKTGEAKSAGKNKRVGKSSLYRIGGLLRQLSEEYLKMDFNEAHEEAMKALEAAQEAFKKGKKEEAKRLEKNHSWYRFYNRVEGDKILNDYDRKFKPSTKAKIYKTVRKFLKTAYGENKYYPPYCENWVTEEKTPTKEYLTRAEVDKLVQAASWIRLKCLIMMLFDGGFRIEELANLRWTDLRKPEGQQFYQAHVRAETSKTGKERYVSLWLATDMIEAYRNHEKEQQGAAFSENAFMFESSYRAIYGSIVRLGKTILNKKISAHTMRHSSATYYASICKTYQQFCFRYGWSLRSSMAQRYWHPTEDLEIADQAKDHEIARFKTEFERVKLENIHLRNDMETNKVVIDKLSEKVDAMDQLIIESGLADRILKEARKLRK